METKHLLEEAVKAWEYEIKELKRTAEWISDETHTGISIKTAIHHKKELIEKAKKVIKGS